MAEPSNIERILISVKEYESMRRSAAGMAYVFSLVIFALAFFTRASGFQFDSESIPLKDPELYKGYAVFFSPFLICAMGAAYLLLQIRLRRFYLSICETLSKEQSFSLLPSEMFWLDTGRNNEGRSSLQNALLFLRDYHLYLIGTICFLVFLSTYLFEMKYDVVVLELAHDSEDAPEVQQLLDPLRQANHPLPKGAVIVSVPTTSGEWEINAQNGTYIVRRKVKSADTLKENKATDILEEEKSPDILEIVLRRPLWQSCLPSGGVNLFAGTRVAWARRAPSKHIPYAYPWLPYLYLMSAVLFVFIMRECYRLKASWPELPRLIADRTEPTSVRDSSASE